MAGVTMVLGPASIFTWPHLLNAYIKINVLHNPTVIALRPVAIVQFLAVYRYIVRGESGGALPLIFFTVLSAFTKPNFNLCLLPAIAIHHVIELMRSRLSGKLVAKTVLFIALPITILMGWQFYTEYSSGTSGSGIMWAPMMVAMASSAHPFIELWLSCLLPTIAIALNPRWLLDDALLRFSLLCFVSSLFFTYLFSESGARALDGNFWWGSQVCLLVLFLAVIKRLVEEYVDALSWKRLFSNNWKFVLILTTFVIHLVSGIAYFSTLLAGNLQLP